MAYKAELKNWRTGAGQRKVAGTSSDAICTPSPPALSCRPRSCLCLGGKLELLANACSVECLLAIEGHRGGGGSTHPEAHVPEAQAAPARPSDQPVPAHGIHRNRMHQALPPPHTQSTCPAAACQTIREVCPSGMSTTTCIAHIEDSFRAWHWVTVMTAQSTPKSPNSWKADACSCQKSAGDCHECTRL